MQLSFKKPEWLDTAVGIAGFVLSLLSALALIEGPNFPIKWAVYVSLAVGFLIITLSVLFRPRHSLRLVQRERLLKYFLNMTKSSQQVIVINLTNIPGELHKGITELLSTNVGATIIGDASEIKKLLDTVNHAVIGNIYRSVLVSGNTASDGAILFVQKSGKLLSALLFVDQRSLLLKLWDLTIVDVLVKIIKREHIDQTGHLRLTRVSDPKEFLDAAVENHSRYMEIFRSLEKGERSYYGTEVQMVQSAWIESRRFQSVDAFDITTSPELLSKRVRYWNANKAFVAAGGRIRRVLMIEENRVRDPQFMNLLRELIGQQIAFGISVGGQILEHLPVNMRRDFIIYGSSVVLVEDRQASADYSLGRSTAYFTAEAIRLHQEIFEAVWSGRASGIQAEALAAQWAQQHVLAAGVTPSANAPNQ
jgi:hypothetical protein